MVIPMYSSESDITAAAGLVRSGGIVVFPTETVYGLGADALNATAVRRVFDAKGRPADNPLIVHLAELSQVGLVAAEISPSAHRLLVEYAPGPLTIILPARPELPRVVTAGLDTVAVRIPAHPVAHAFLSAADVPVAAPSANRSGEPSPTTAAMARRSLGDQVDAYLDGGACQVGLESTVIRVIHDRVTILRPGAVTEADILQVLPDVSVDGGIAAGDPGTERETARSPGTRHRHYQPKAEVCVFATVGEMRALLRDTESEGPIFVIVPEVMRQRLAPVLEEHGLPVALRSYASPGEYARALYAWFGEADTVGAVRVLACLPEATGIGAAIRDRLLRASGAG